MKEHEDKDQYETPCLLTAGYRPWMDNGVTFTTNQDHMYVGHKVEDGSDQTAAVIQWADNELSPAGPDVMKFIFTSNFTGGSGPTSNDGREIARMHPTGYLGVGNWQATLFQPDERIDVLDRTIRIRKLIDDYRNDTIAKVVVVDTSGRLHWRPIDTWPTPGGSGDCDWERFPSNKTVNTAFSPIPTIGDCPELDWLVGIGVGPTQTNFKLEIEHDEDNASASGGLSVNFLADNPGWAHGTFSAVRPTNSSLEFAAGVQGEAHRIDSAGYGLYGLVNAAPSDGHTKEIFGASGFATTSSGITKSAYGVRGESIVNSGATATSSYGVYGQASTAGGTTTSGYGVYGVSNTGTDSYGLWGWARSGTNRYSVYGRSPGGGANDWSGYFTGRLWVTGTGHFVNNTVIVSDGQFKTDVEDLSNCTDILEELMPKTYSFIPQQHPHLSFAEGEQIGMIAQEVEAVVPSLVHSVSLAAVNDSLGNEISPAIDLKALNYTGLIPILIGGFKEQQIVIEEQTNQLAAQQAQIEALTDQASANQAATDELEELRNRMDQLEQLLAACCQNPADPRSQQIDATGGILENERILRIQPNPFTEQTTIYYQLQRSGRMQLMANSSDGKQLRVLEEAHREAAAYQYEWITNDLAPGIYYVTLLLDGEPVVKKAVKVR